jgi:small-conductance mechanosensitive channel
MRIILLLLSLFFTTTHILAVEEDNTQASVIDSNNIEVQALLRQKDLLEQKLIEDNIWSKIYSNYHTYKELKKQQLVIDADISHLEKKKKLTSKQKKLLEKDKEERMTLLGKLDLLEEYSQDPFKKFLKAPHIEEIPTVGNPLVIIGALSFQEKLNSDKEEYDARYESLSSIMTKLKGKEEILEKLLTFSTDNKDYAESYKNVREQIKTFSPVLEIFKTSSSVYTKKVDEIKIKLQREIKREISKAVMIGAIILFFILLLLLIKYFVRKYMSDNERYYTINKALNSGFILLSILTILFAYIENVSYLVTILGFASAGIAIAMKDWFMSLMGWATIVLGGAISVGDRVKFVRDGVEYVGDIVDISMLRMTMHEDITLTSYMVNRRAGRMVFIPNNFIFTDMISNYSHAGLKTVWDGIDFVITFDSDANKASSIAKEIAKKYAKGYTEITRKQLNKLRSRYGMRNTNVEPRIFTHIEPYGMKISVWYLTNSFATMTLRSTISIEIITRIQEEASIQLAYPSQSIFMDQNTQKTHQNPIDALPTKEL